jgi:hypothetical protein
MVQSVATAFSSTEYLSVLPPTRSGPAKRSRLDALRSRADERWFDPDTQAILRRPDVPLTAGASDDT